MRRAGKGFERYWLTASLAPFVAIGTARSGMKALRKAVFGHPSLLEACEPLPVGVYSRPAILVFMGEAAMPTYRYRCVRCDETFERVESVSEHGAAKPRCPKCGGEEVVQVPAPFVAVTSKKS